MTDYARPAKSYKNTAHRYNEALPLAVFMGLTGLTQQVILIQSGMPTAVTSTILATEFHGDAGFTSAVVLISTLASVVTLSILLTIFM